MKTTLHIILTALITLVNTLKAIKIATISRVLYLSASASAAIGLTLTLANHGVLGDVAQSISIDSGYEVTNMAFVLWVMILVAHYALESFMNKISLPAIANNDTIIVGGK